MQLERNAPKERTAVGQHRMAIGELCTAVGECRTYIVLPPK